MAEDNQQQPGGNQSAGQGAQPPSGAAGQPPVMPPSQPPGVPTGQPSLTGQPPTGAPGQPVAPPPPPAGPRLPQPPPGYQPVYAYAPQPRRSGVVTAIWVVLVLLLVAFVTILVGSYVVSQMGGGGGGTYGANTVGVVSVVGVIRDGGQGSLFAPPGARGIMAELRRAGRDDNIKAVVLLVDSPGGSAAASAAIYEEIMKLRQRKPVVACMTDIAASGGFYISCAANKIVAGGSTMTGSIGVIFEGMGFYPLMKKIGIVNETQTAGKFKDIGSPLRAMTPEEKSILQGLLNDTYNQFLAAVAKGRKMSLAQVEKLAEGRIYTGDQAQKLGLVDQIGDFYDAVDVAAQLGGITGKPHIYYLGQPKGLLAGLTGADSSTYLRGLSAGDLQGLHGPLLLAPFVYKLVSAEPGVEVRVGK